MNPEKIVNKLLGEQAKIPTYVCIKLDDFLTGEPSLGSDSFDELLGEISDDGATVTVRDLEHVKRHYPEHDWEAQKLITVMNEVGATLVILV